MDSNAENYINDQSIEICWAMKASKQADIHYNLLQACKDCSNMRLTSKDNELFVRFNEMFPNFRLDVISNDDIKNDEAKAKWREYCMEFEGIVDDFNFASLLRLDCRKPYDDDNTTIVPRVQFLAIEIARNKNHLNNNL